MAQKYLLAALLVLLSNLFLSSTALAYLDPGTGSMLLTTLVGLLATLFFFLRKIYYVGIRGVLAILGIRSRPIDTHDIVIYSEGKQYWSTFKPLLDEFEKRKITILFLTSDPKDPVFQIKHSSYCQSKFIGTGNKAYTCLNFLEAKICIMTTPGLGVLQIKRSPGVKHYIHLVHAPGDIHTYKLYSFDYYDSFFASGPHQEKTLRELEKIRGTSAKQIVAVGCIYYDSLAKVVSRPKMGKRLTVLVAPSWGKNGLIAKYGISLFKRLLDADINIILRPHPQSFISEPELIAKLEVSLNSYNNLTWDRENDGFGSMQKADFLISDFSAITLDFSFLFEKPVFTLEFEFNPLGYEADELPHLLAWEFSLFDQIGKKIKEDDLEGIVQILQSLQSDSFVKTVRKIKKVGVYNFGKAAPVAVDNITRILKELE
jgi:hypothetical protein